MFAPTSHGDDLLMANSAVEVGEGRCVMLVVENLGGGVVHLRSG